MRWWGVLDLLSLASNHRSSERRVLYLCTCILRTRFAHRSHMDRFYPYRTRANLTFLGPVSGS